MSFVLGPIETNTYLLADNDSKAAIVVDPTFECQPVVEELERRGWSLRGIWLTHAHFDHIAGIATLQAAFTEPVPIGLHPADLELYHNRGDAGVFGIHLPAAPEPDLWFSHGQVLSLGEARVEVRHAPGHTPGHVMFYNAAEKFLISGDVLFQGSIGRTDLAGGNTRTLLESIHSQALTLPDETVVYPGHGPQTTLGIERITNPFL